MIQNKRYAWRLFSTEDDTSPIDEVVLDVDASEALRIDRDLGVAVTQVPKPAGPFKIKVLLADDHAVLRQGLGALLQAERDLCVVGEAGNGRKAVEMTRELVPDVVVMDLAMPVLDGLDAIRQINALHLKSKVLILSYHTDPDHVKRTIDAGAMGYVVKQAVAREVIKAIHEVTNGRAFFSPSIARRLIASGPQTGTGEDGRKPAPLPGPRTRLSQSGD